MLRKLRKTLRWFPVILVLVSIVSLLAPRQAAADARGPAPALSLVAAGNLGGPGLVAASPAPTPVPILYQFFDWGTDFRNVHPEWGPVGSVHFATWERINPGPGAYNWDWIDSYLAKERPLTVQLRSGEVIPKPVVLKVLAHLSSYPDWRGIFYDATPRWVYERIEAAGGGPLPEVNGRKVGHLLEGCDQPVVMPMYEHPIWQRAFQDMVRALGRRYDQNPQLTAVIIATGLDGETQHIKDLKCPLKAQSDREVSGLSYRFQQFVLDTMRVYREAFPTKALFIDNCPGGAGLRVESSRLAASLNPPVGLKNSGLWMDFPNHQGIGNAVGAWDPIATYSETLPIMLESVYGFGGPEQHYWSWFAALNYHPVALDVHPGFLQYSDPAWLAFVQRHLGVTPENTPDVWTVLRDSEFEPVLWGEGRKDGYSGKIGDWTFWMKRIEGLPGQKTVHVTRADLPEAVRGDIQSRHARRTDQASGNTMMSFNIDDRVWFAGQQAPPVRFKVVMIFLNHGNDTLSLEYKNRQGQLVRKTLQKGTHLGPADQWYKQIWVIDDAVFENGLPGGADVRINCNGDGDETVRSLLVGDSTRF